MAYDHEFHSRNRDNFVSAMDENSIAVFHSAPPAVRNGDVHYPYRQDSNFSYLTGFDEPDAIAVLVKESDNGRYILFCRERNPKQEQWEGEIIGPKRAVGDYRADESHSTDRFEKLIAKLVADKTKIYLPQTHRHDPFLDNYLESEDKSGNAKHHCQLMTADYILNELRLIKSAEEVARIKQAARITAIGFARALAELKPGMYEYQIEAELMYAYHSSNATMAYPNIVAGGERALVLHYQQNHQLLNEGDLLLIDSGAEFQSYASDVSRTYPVNGRYSPAQKALYELVLDAQTVAIDQARVGRSWIDPHQEAVKILVSGLHDLGILKESVENSLANKSYQRFYPHRTSHWLGMDVHDVGEYQIERRWRELEAGMVFTVEPGLYIPVAEDIPEEFRGIGIRIEDDILVRANKPAQVLTRAIASDPDEIEGIMRDAAR